MLAQSIWMGLFVDWVVRFPGEAFVALLDRKPRLREKALADMAGSMAALWFLQYVAYRGDAVSFSAGELGGWLRAHGFDAPSCRPLIPDITMVLVSRRTP